MIVSRRRACRSSMWSAYAGNLLAARLGVRREVVELDRPSAPAPCRARPSRRRGRWSGRCRARCSRCRPRSGSGSTVSPKQWAVTRAPCSCAVAIAVGERLGGNDGARSPSSREIQSPTSLTQPSPRSGLLGDVRRQVVGLDLVGVVADVAPGAGDVAAAADQPRQVVALVDPAGVGRRAAVAQQQRAGVAVGDRLLLGGRPRRPRRARRARGGSGRRPAPARSSPRRPSRPPPPARR